MKFANIIRNLYCQASRDFQEITQLVYNKIKFILNKKYIEGYATCTYAVYELGKELYKNSIPFQVISGEYNEVGHWWIELNNGIILDIGNNIKFTDGIKVYIGKNDGNYVKEDIMTYDEYLEEYKSIKYF